MLLIRINASKAIYAVKGDQKCTSAPERVWGIANFCGDGAEKQLGFSLSANRAEATAVIDFNNSMNRKDLKRAYKETLRPTGIFQIRNLQNERVFIGSSLNLDGILNRNRFQLEAGSHPSKDLQRDWNALGAENFEFEVLEEIVPRENLDYKSELEVLEDLWLEKLKPYGEKGYNERKKTREERLRMIAANRKL